MSVEQFDPKRPEKGWHPATPLPEPRIWKLWRWLRLMPPQEGVGKEERDGAS